MKERIVANLPNTFPWMKTIHYFDTIGSTNDEARRMAKSGAPHGTVLIAGHQTGGHGRRGRSFHSPAGSGIYMSVLLRPDCAPTELMHLTCAAAVAMCDAIEQAVGFRPGIKWTNDLVCGKRKVGGILTELGFTNQGLVDYAIIGIGINCTQTELDFPEDIRSIAASLAMVSQTRVEADVVAAAMIQALQKMDSQLLSAKAQILAQYKKDCITLGQEIVLLRGDGKRYGIARDIDPDGGLVVEFQSGTLEVVSSGEVSVRGMYGYV
jgi:BirA family biotin operon repressor/biotin-[acetyl-CoA-carboxylase] ligase